MSRLMLCYIAICDPSLAIVQQCINSKYAKLDNFLISASASSCASASSSNARELDEQILEVKINPQETNTASDTSTNKDTLSKEKETENENEETKLIRNDFTHFVGTPIDADLRKKLLVWLKKWDIISEFVRKRHRKVRQFFDDFNADEKLQDRERLFAEDVFKANVDVTTTQLKNRFESMNGIYKSFNFLSPKNIIRFQQQNTSRCQDPCLEILPPGLPLVQSQRCTPYHENKTFCHAENRLFVRYGIKGSSNPVPEQIPAGYRRSRTRVTTLNEDRYLEVTAKRSRRSTASDLSRQFSLATGTTDSRQTVYRCLGHIGLYARRPVRCVPLTATHCRLRLT
ncbi:transposable element Tcb1 transposase [Trichonephila clavipes]|nr:transposable element Tcb1 transposase [Trichonephila clavipes]